jgi:hypothetical protein
MRNSFVRVYVDSQGFSRIEAGGNPSVWRGFMYLAVTMECVRTRRRCELCSLVKYYENVSYTNIHGRLPLLAHADIQLSNKENRCGRMAMTTGT